MSRCLLPPFGLEQKVPVCPVGAGTGSLGLERQCSLVVESTDAGTRLPSQVSRWDSEVRSVICASVSSSIKRDENDSAYLGVVVRSEWMERTEPRAWQGVRKSL